VLFQPDAAWFQTNKHPVKSAAQAVYLAAGQVPMAASTLRRSSHCDPETQPSWECNGTESACMVLEGRGVNATNRNCCSGVRLRGFVRAAD
jgi:hypothetical protein